ncbi:hypothetical protein TNIN_423061 [Trichonephila inaurata madagascariensis]|uniref:Uncharacterized protein n=1 Tax=Trichonephila inaurata madagascariensis TaxID=2747483 RepID=A0A8X7C357_9ARAC|nr:hypothetical protein TNIN_423061 [Trichonephila inaurata madagascariensis]
MELSMPLIILTYAIFSETNRHQKGRQPFLPKTNLPEVDTINGPLSILWSVKRDFSEVSIKQRMRACTYIISVLDLRSFPCTNSLEYVDLFQTSFFETIFC